MRVNENLLAPGRLGRVFVNRRARAISSCYAYLIHLITSVSVGRLPYINTPTR